MAKKILTEHINVPGIETFDVYRQHGGYTAVEKALKTMTPEEVVEDRLYGVDHIAGGEPPVGLECEGGVGGDELFRLAAQARLGGSAEGEVDEPSQRDAGGV